MRQNPLRTVYHGYLTAKRSKELGKLSAHGPCSKDKQRFGQMCEINRFPIRNVASLLKACYRRNKAFGTSCQHKLCSAVDLATSFNLMGRNKCSFFVNQM